MENNINPRAKVLEMLIKTLKDGVFSNVCLSEVLSDGMIEARDRAFVSRLYMGVLEKLVFLDFVIDSFSKIPVRKMKEPVADILRMGVYQLIFMDSVPDHAAINECVKLAEKKGFRSLKGFVNGVLRSAQRGYSELRFPDYVKACVPEWLYRLVCTQYGKDAAGGFFEAVNSDNHGTAIRLVTNRETPEKIIDMLESEGCILTDINGSRGNAYAAEGFKSLTGLTAFKKGFIIMQDISSMRVAETAAGGFKEGKKPELIVDVCAAPGGKSLYLAEIFPDSQVISRDKTEEKTALIKENTARLGIKNIKTQVFDATATDPLLEGKADLVVCDVPCSGIGVIGKKPDIRHRLKEIDLKEISALQMKILEASEKYVKKGGILMYSTCTINKDENENQVKAFLASHTYACEEEITVLPGRDKGDGFYMARLRKS